jgi:hypothetical protein
LVTAERQVEIRWKLLKREEAHMAYSYACGDFPGIEQCAAKFTAETEEELWKHIELHGTVAHNNDPGTWSPEVRAQIRSLWKEERTLKDEPD